MSNNVLHAFFSLFFFNVWDLHSFEISLFLIKKLWQWKNNCCTHGRHHLKHQEKGFKFFFRLMHMCAFPTWVHESVRAFLSVQVCALKNCLHLHIYVYTYLHACFFLKPELCVTGLWGLTAKRESDKCDEVSAMLDPVMFSKHRNGTKRTRASWLCKAA